MLSAICFNLDQFKILPSGNELNLIRLCSWEKPCSGLTVLYVVLIQETCENTDVRNGRLTFRNDFQDKRTEQN